jgi:hypothetical protein
VSDRAVAAAYAGALAFVVSYAAQRGAGWWLMSDAGVLKSAHVAFYWRCVLAGLHAAMAAGIVGAGARDPGSLVRARWVVWAVVVPSALALAVFR